MNDVTRTVRSVCLHTLGCKLNYSETASIGRQFAERGYVVTDNAGSADIFLLNTCSVTENAEKECRKLIRRVLRANPNTFIAVTGCYAQLRAEEIASIDGVDVVLGASEKFRIFDTVNSFDKRKTPLIQSRPVADAQDFHLATSESSTGRTRAFLKVQDGCDYNCSFCTIPEARGASRSAAVQHIVDEAISLSERGFLEIILSGVNVGDFGRKIGSSFYELLSALNENERVTARIRISSVEPNLLTDDVIDLVARSGKFCRHFHVPLQSGSPRILKLMQRRYNRDHYEGRVEMIKRLMPDACIGADVIVGFPGEMAEEFEETIGFVRAVDLSYLHVFTYSERPGTKAASMPSSIDVHERRERNERLRILSEKKLRAFYESQIGKTTEVVLEGRSINCEPQAPAITEGYSDNYVRVRFDDPIGAEITRVEATLHDIMGGTAIGQVLNVLSTRRASTLELPVLA